MINVSKLYKEYLDIEKNEHLNKIFSTILKHVKKDCPNQRRPKYPPLYYLINIHSVLKDNVLWKSLAKSKFCLNNNNYHYKTIADIHRLWCEHGIYEKAHREIINKNIIRSRDGAIKLFIDATSIINKLGSENIGYGTETKKKQFTKLTGVCNEFGVNVAIKCEDVNTKIIKFNNKDQTIRTLIHDAKTVIPTCQILRKMDSVKPSDHIELIADKGYLTKKVNKEIMAEQKCSIVTPLKKNQKAKITEEEKEKLKGRYVVENMFSDIKIYNRVHVRRDRNINNYMGFVYIACMLQSLMKNKSLSEKKKKLIIMNNNNNGK